MTIDEVLRNRKILITGGTGGVGKTTISAALAVRSALLGNRTAVVTIDPAKRLATSLGLKELGDHPTDLTEHLAKSEIGSGSLHAVIPDTRKTFENFVADLAPTPQTKEKILANPIFHMFAKEFSGANEYMAMQRLYRLYRSGHYDTIILDTPPSRNTLAFLDAPKLLGRFFDEKVIRWLVLPTNRLVSAGMKKALGILEKLTGSGFMGHLLDFASALFEVRENFLKNLNGIEDLLASEKTGFLLVTRPTAETAEEVSHFVESVRSHGFHFDGIALNRTYQALSVTKDELDRTRGEVRSALELIRSLQKREEGTVEAIFKVPELARDVHSVGDLIHIAKNLT